VADDGLQNVRPQIVQNVWPEIVRTIGRRTAFRKDDKMKIAVAGMESQKVQFPLAETREEEIDSSTSGEENDDVKEEEQMHVLALLARAAAPARVYRELVSV